MELILNMIAMGLKFSTTLFITQLICSLMSQLEVSKHQYGVFVTEWLWRSETEDVLCAETAECAGV